MSDFATSADVLNRWIGDNPPTATLADQLLADALVLLKLEFRTLEERIASNELSMDRVVLAQVRMVIRALRNPDNVRSRGIGPLTSTYAGDDPGGLIVTDDERSLLAEPDGSFGGRQRAFTINPTSPLQNDRDALWCASVNGGMDYQDCW